MMSALLKLEEQKTARKDVQFAMVHDMSPAHHFFHFPSIMIAGFAPSAPLGRLMASLLLNYLIGPVPASSVLFPQALFFLYSICLCGCSLRVPSFVTWTQNVFGALHGRFEMD